MLRKLLLSAGMLYIYQGSPLQLAVGFVVSFVFLIGTYAARPYVNANLNALQILGLSIQCFTLFCRLHLTLSAQSCLLSPLTRTLPPVSCFLCARLAVHTRCTHGTSDAAHSLSLPFFLLLRWSPSLQMA